MKKLSRLPRLALVLLAVSAAVAGCAEASATSGVLSLVSAGVGLAGYLLFFGAVVAGRPVLFVDEGEDDDEGGTGEAPEGPRVRPQP